MKKSFVLTAVTLMLFIGMWIGFDYLSHSGEFTLESDSSASQELLDDANPIYLSYGIKWEGTGTPTLERIEMIRRDGTIADTHLAESFIATTNIIGVMDGESVEKGGLTEELRAVNEFQPKDAFHLVIRVDDASDLAENDI
ncbi:hypothetical protein [Jeotgalibacillus sp. JSM ZJ347]|uniref:hypothetical protein n=1 Tax=Jeotgalibacillus sp. JSM ZJ347 TaxID=3342117 RepID=UPI0035A8BA5C